MITTFPSHAEFALDPFANPYFPREVASIILSELKTKELFNCCLVSKKWHQLASKEIAPSMIFDSRKWKKYYRVNIDVPLPKNAEEILKARSPTVYLYDSTVRDLNRRVHHDFFMVLIPSKISPKVPLDLESIRILDKNVYGYNILNYERHELKNLSLPRPEWYLISKNLIPKTNTARYYENQKDIVSRLGEGYEIPTLLVATVSLMAHQKLTGKALFDGIPRSLTRCQETLPEKGTGKRHLYLTNSEPSGKVMIVELGIGSFLRGAGAMRKLSP